MEWIKISEKLPDADSQHGRTFESEEVLLDCGDFFIVSRYQRRYDKHLRNVLYAGFPEIEDSEQEIVQRWCKITR